MNRTSREHLDRNVYKDVTYVAVQPSNGGQMVVGAPQPPMIGQQQQQVQYAQVPMGATTGTNVSYEAGYEQ